MADAKISALTAITTVDGSDELGINDGGASKRINIDQLIAYAIKRIAGSSGAAGPWMTWQNLTANATANSTTTLTTVMTTTGVGAGTWKFKYTVIYQAGATSTGVNFAIEHSGTITDIVVTSSFTTNGGAAANALADQATDAVANLMEGKSARANNTGVGSTLGVDTANADMMMVIEGIVVVTASGELRLKHASEVAASSQVMADSCLELTKIE
jgi:hypothetical protein